jgi:hypothetical protein
VQWQVAGEQQPCTRRATTHLALLLSPLVSTRHRRLFHRSWLFAPNSITTAAFDCADAIISHHTRTYDEGEIPCARRSFFISTREIAISDLIELQLVFTFFHVSCSVFFPRAGVLNWQHALILENRMLQKAHWNDFSIGALCDFDVGRAP